MIQAGKLRHFVSLQSYTATRDAHGAEIETWAQETKFWAERVSDGGREFIAAQQRWSELSALFRVRHRTDVTAKKRLVHDGHTYEIKAAWDPEGRRIETLIACTEPGNG